MNRNNEGSLYTFIDHGDELSAVINKKAGELFQQLNGFDVQGSGIDDFGKYYFATHHTGKRLFFSIESSADIIYRSVKRVGKDIGDTSFTDYGAGLGTLFLLAGKMGFKTVFYNDLFPVWCDNAKIICKQLSIPVTDFIAGDIDALINYGKNNTIHFDIIASRNVIEHIYRLRSFYSKLYESGLTTVCYATTTANYHNIAMRIKHYRYHGKMEMNVYRKQRETEIRKWVPGINEKDCAELVKITRGRAFTDFTDAVNLYLDKKPVPPVEFLQTNTCDCITGVWAENIITKNNYTDIIEKAGFAIDYSAGFWDTHYKYGVVNLITRSFNSIIKILGKKGYWLSPFVNVVAYNKQS
jgi:hypothetical protein